MKFHIRGLAKLQRKLQKMGRNFEGAQKKAMEESLILLHSSVPPYSSVPKRRGQTYRRTGLLGRSITALQGSAPSALSRVRSLVGDVQGIWGSAVRYARWVIGEETQVWFHRDRWYTLEGQVRKNSGRIVKIFAKHMRDLMR